MLFILLNALISCERSLENSSKNSLSNSPYSTPLNIVEKYLPEYPSTQLRPDIHLFTQTQDPLIASLSTMNAKSLDCSATAYWNIIQMGKESIPALIESLSDTTETDIFHHCKKGNLNIGEVAYFALKEIGEFPEAMVVQAQFDLLYEDGCWSFFDYLFENRNKPHFKAKMIEFFQKSTYKYAPFTQSEMTDCRVKFNIKGRLILVHA